MTIHRGKLPGDHFTMIPNRWARDHTLPWAARGLLAWLMSHAQGYKITEELICASGPSSRDAVRTMIQALEKAGYLKRIRTSLPTGGSTVDYLLQDPGDGYIDSLEVDFSDPRPDQGEQGASAAQPNDGKSDPRSYGEDQEKTKTPSVSRRAPRSATATRVPDDFVPDEKMREWFAAEKLGQVIDGRWEHDKFMDYWRAEPGTKGRKLDWPATWRRWMRTAADRAGTNGSFARAVSAPPGNSLMPAGAPSNYRPSTTDQRVAQTLDLGRRLMEEMQ